MGFMDSFYIFRTHLIVFFGDYFGFESVEKHTSTIMALLTVTHMCSFFMMIYEPLFVSCFDYSDALTLTDIISFFASTMTLIGLYFCHIFDSTHYCWKVGRTIHYLHFAGLIWLPILAVYWFVCFSDIRIPNLSSDEPPFVLNYGPLTLNSCFINSSNCYNSYFFRQVQVLTMSAIVGVGYSTYIFIMRELDRYIMSKYQSEGMAAWAASTSGRGNRRGFFRSDSLSNQFYSDSMHEPLRRLDASNSYNSSSDEQIPFDFAAEDSSGMKSEEITILKKQNRVKIHGQEFEFEVHAPKDVGTPE